MSVMPDSVENSSATPLMIFKYLFLNVKDEFLVGIISKLQKSCLRMYEESHFHYTNLSLQISMVSFTGVLENDECSPRSTM